MRILHVIPCLFTLTYIESAIAPEMSNPRLARRGKPRFGLNMTNCLSLTQMTRTGGTELGLLLFKNELKPDLVVETGSKWRGMAW